MPHRYIIEFDMKHPEYWLFNCGAYNSQTGKYEKNHGFKYGGNTKISAQNMISNIRKTFAKCEPYNFIIYDCKNVNPIIAHRSKKGAK